MKAIVLIGGFGTRLRPITLTVPKQLIPIAGRPMLYHVLDLLPADLEEAVLATGYRADAIDRYVREHPPRIPVRCVAETEPLGTGGGMKNVAEGMSDPFFLLNSDVIAEIDAGRVAAALKRSDVVGAMSLAEVEDTSPYGVAALGPDDRIDRFVEKPKPADAPSHWINAGFSAWRREVLDGIPAGRPVSFESEVMPGLLPRGIRGVRLNGFWEDAGTPERLLRAQRLLFDAKRGGRGTVPAGALGTGPVAAGRGVTADGASFGPYVTLGDGVRVDPGAHVENSVVMDGAHLEREAFVSGSILGPRARVRATHRLHGAVVGEAGEA
ncbi:MAG TPA: NDP-sugar synthase [Thermoplasmata archaeon]|nr:NDP-sugar synthase [Thermoplasmata archaeon]